MTIEAISAVAAEGVLQPTAVAGTVGVEATGDFGSWFAGELKAVNAQLVQADQGVRQLAAGEPVSLHDVMIKLEEARLSFQLLAQVRNRVLEAYQEVMRTQV